MIGNPIEPTLTFESKLDERLFLAILSSHPDQRVFVKLVSGHYSQQVHEHLAAKGLAPKLYGYVKVDGAPTAYIVVATTRHSRTNDLTTSKALQWAIK